MTTDERNTVSDEDVLRAMRAAYGFPPEYTDAAIQAAGPGLMIVFRAALAADRAARPQPFAACPQIGGLFPDDTDAG
jgi:hypothetical protein